MRGRGMMRLLTLLPLWPLLAIPTLASSLPSQTTRTFLQHKHKKKRVGADVYYVAETLDKLKFATSAQQVSAEVRYKTELERLDAAMELATQPTDRALLQTTIQRTEESKMEEINAFKAMYGMYYTLKSLFGAASGAPSCEFLRCGEHADCVMKGTRAHCECKPCFEGNGFACRASTCTPTGIATAQPMYLHLTSGAPEMEEVHVSVFSEGQTSRIAVAFRDRKQNDRGFLMLGTAQAAEIKWGQLQGFSKDMAAYQPQISVLPTGRVVVSFRDDPSKGVGYVAGGRIDETDRFKTIMLHPHEFETNLFEASPLVQLAMSRVVCLYAHPKAKNIAYGGVVFIQVGKGGTLNVLGKYRFADGPVSHVAAVAMRPTSFVVAYREPPVPGESQSAYSRELSMVWMAMDDNEIIKDPHPIVIDHQQKDMGLRDVALVSENLVAYSYQSNSERKTKVAIVRVDPSNHRMEVTGSPKVIASGGTTFVKSISTPFVSLAPHTLTYTQRPTKSSIAEACSISMEGRVTKCQSIHWANMPAATASAARLLDGRLVFVLAETGNSAPYYHMIAPPS